jgi:hypothetical protein
MTWLTAGVRPGARVIALARPKLLSLQSLHSKARFSTHNPRVDVRQRNYSLGSGEGTGRKCQPETDGLAFVAYGPHANWEFVRKCTLSTVDCRLSTVPTPPIPKRVDFDRIFSCFWFGVNSLQGNLVRVLSGNEKNLALVVFEFNLQVQSRSRPSLTPSDSDPSESRPLTRSRVRPRCESAKSEFFGCRLNLPTRKEASSSSLVN